MIHPFCVSQAVGADNNLLVTCGLTLDRSGAVQVDNFLKIIDVRLGMRVLNVLQFQAGECLLLLISYGQLNCIDGVFCSQGPLA